MGVLTVLEMCLRQRSPFWRTWKKESILWFPINLPDSAVTIRNQNRENMVIPSLVPDVEQLPNAF